MDAGSDGSPQSVGLLLLLQLILILINAYFAAAEIAVIVHASSKNTVTNDTALISIVSHPLFSY